MLEVTVHYSYKAISLILAIFCAILIEKAQHVIILDGIVAHIRGERAHITDHLWTFLVTCAWFVSLTFFSYIWDKYHLRLWIWVEHIATHVVAFGCLAFMEYYQHVIGHHLEHMGSVKRLLAFYIGWVPLWLAVYFCAHRGLKSYFFLFMFFLVYFVLSLKKIEA